MGGKAYLAQIMPNMNNATTSRVGFLGVVSNESLTAISFYKNKSA